MATTATRPAPAVSRITRIAKNVKPVPLTTDQLADAFASNVTISNFKGKQKAVAVPALSDEQIRVAAMHAVNSASQALSGLVQSGWKKSVETNSPSKTTAPSASTLAAAAEKHLGMLRKLCPGDLDVERAAISVLAKLVALEMHDLAHTALSEIHSRLCALLNVPIPTSTIPTPSPLHLLLIPIPSPIPTDNILLTLTSTYLAYSLSILSQSTSNIVDLFANTLILPNNTSLLVWVPIFSSLPAKHMDSVLTRAYTALTKLCAVIHATPTPQVKVSTRVKSGASKAKPPTEVGPCPQSLFQLRMYAISCLVHTSPSTIDPSTFWDQAIRFGAAFIKSSTSSSRDEDRATELVLRSYTDLIKRVEKGSDRNMSLIVSGDAKSKSFFAFCEYWMAFAKRAGDICALEQISALIGQAGSSSPPSSISSSPTTFSPDLQPTEAPVAPPMKVPRDKATLVLEGTRICASFAQVTALLEQAIGKYNEKEEGSTTDNDLVRHAKECTILLKNSKSLATLLAPSDEGEPGDRDEGGVKRISGKVDRAFERMRRAGIKLLDSPSISSIVVGLLRACTDVLQRVLTASNHTMAANATTDILTRTLDTLFILARTQLSISDPRTYVPAYEYLSQAASILDFITPSAHADVDISNYMRCVSGAFYNLAGSLYQGTRYGAAVPVLREACVLGGKALAQRKGHVVKGKDEEGWKQLEEQLYRRWELLGVCYSKNGDRKNAYSAFVRCIYTFPYSSSGFSLQTDEKSPTELFSLNQQTKQLAVIVDRVTYIGACELLLPAEEVSLGQSSGDDSITLDSTILGALLERQLDALEPSRWKEGVREITAKLLHEALNLYGADMPVRRARVLVRCMEFGYREHEEAVSQLGLGNVAEMGEEVESLLSDAGLAGDDTLGHYRAQYRATAHIWLALHAHKRVEPAQNTVVAHHTGEACQILKELLLSGAGGRGPRKSGSPKVTRGTRGLSSPKVNAASRAEKNTATASPKARPSRLQRVPAAPRKPVARKKELNPITPKAPTRAALHPVAMNVTATPPRPAMDPNTANTKPSLTFDDFEKFLDLLQLTSRILGLLSLMLPKVHNLNITRRLCEHQLGTSSDGYITASIDLAHEYFNLGKRKRAVTIFNQAMDAVKSGNASNEVCALFFLRFAESLAVIEDVSWSSSVYSEAISLVECLDPEQKGMSTVQRIQTRVRQLEKAAMASRVVALIQYSQEDVSASLEGMKQSLRLWNRAVDTLTQLSSPPSKPASESNPFEMASLKDALPKDGPDAVAKEDRAPKKVYIRRPSMDGLEWRVSEGLFVTLFSLSRAYLARGSALEAEYFAKQAQDLAEALNSPAMVSRALARRGEVQLHLGQLDEGYQNLLRAAELLHDIPGIDIADIYRLRAVYNERIAQNENAQKLYVDIINVLKDLDAAFRQLDGVAFGPRNSIGVSPGGKANKEILVPDLLAAVLRRHIWLLRDESDDVFQALLERFLALPSSSYTKSEENALMAKLTLNNIYERLRSDMFLSSLAESTIALPMGMSSKREMALTPLTNDILSALEQVEKLYWANLALTTHKGSVIDVREAAVSLAIVKAFQTSLGKPGDSEPVVAASLLDASATITLRREMLDAIYYKFPNFQDDLQWPLLSLEGITLPRPLKGVAARFSLDRSLESGAENDEDEVLGLKQYWESIRSKYQTQALDSASLSLSQMKNLPSNWTVIHINVTEDKDTLFVTRQEGGVEEAIPLIFRVPLRRRRDNSNGEDEDEHLGFEDAIEELREIVRLSNEGTKAAVHVKADDEEARVTWWKQRAELDSRMKDLLENIEFCWLGAFKASTILSPRPNLTPEALSDLRAAFDRVFQRSLHFKDKKPKQRLGAHKRNTLSQAQLPSQVALDESLIKCFSTLSPKCKDEEVEDLVYFILDLYQFHGVPVAIAEVDIVQVVVDLRLVLEEHASKTNQRKTSKIAGSSSKDQDEHVFLVLDKNVQGLPWESIPILRGRSVSRIPSIDFLHDRVQFADWKRSRAPVNHPEDSRGAVVNPKNGYFVLNPSGDLGRTEGRFKDWANGMKDVGWDGVMGKSINEQQFLNALKTQDLVIYFGHGGGEQYVRSHKIRSLTSCAATMLWGCSSGALREMGDFDRTGTPHSYMLAGCPTLVANLWDVTDRDIDKFSQSVFDKVGLTPSNAAQWTEQGTKKDGKPIISVVAAVAQSRDSCKLKYLTGAAPVVYGIPFYL
ncbi:cysteine peptidase C50 [Crucibulum laeve]|uniref:separase n=1 Tax=Crucibulum laeve TaxID=68775 RepID=A0A5C3LZ66_9AGAR|nr:cysteine peptidase C50 [Crucibulum laeve]